MARPNKDTVDYFPHIIKKGKTMFILERKYNNNGYTFWFKLLELLGSSPGHFYDYNNPVNWEFLLAETKVTDELANDILKTLATVGAIDDKLLSKKIIWSDNFMKNIEDVYKRRKQTIPPRPIIDNNNNIDDNNNLIDTNSNTQTKLNKTKVKERIYSPTSDEVRLSEMLLNFILQRDPDHKKPDMQKWAVEINRLINIDCRPPDQIERVICWCQEDSFWQNNILSTGKLRKQFSQLRLKAGESEPKTELDDLEKLDREYEKKCQKII